MIGFATLAAPSPELASDNFVFYFPSSHQLLPYQSSGAAKYLAVMQVLNLVGKVEGIQEKKNSIKIFVNSTQIELKANDTKIQMGQSPKMNYELPHPVYLADGQWMVPLDFLTSVLPPLIHQSVEYQAGSNRAFIGDVKPASFSVRVDPLANGVRLAVQFTDKVAVHTSASNGRWIIFLGDRPVEPMEPSYQFQNPYVASLQFDDQDGLPKLIVSPRSAGLNFYPVLADDGKVLMADVVKGSAAAETPAPPGTSDQSPGAVPGLNQPVVVLDPGHGGDDKGGHSKDGVFEKDLTMQYALKVRAALLATNKYRVVLTRTSDANVTAEQRATASNIASAIYFLSFHAGDLGAASPHIAIYTFEPSNTPDTAGSPAAVPDGQAAASAGTAKSAAFVPWEHVQEARLGQSLQLAQSIQQQLTSLNGADVNLPVTAPIRALRNVNAAAVAIEFGRLAPDAPAEILTDPAFQQRIADSIVQALAIFEKGGK